ncbi:MAG: hypothetical protein Q4C03_06430, partial [bacterium]|nr:hypothetical protein [bacterium]
MRKLLFSFFVLLLPFTLVSAVAEIQLSPDVETTLGDNVVYYISSTGEYTVTTGGKAVATRIEMLTGSAVTLVLNNCHICTTNDVVKQSSTAYYGAPLVFTLIEGNLKLQFKGENSLACSSEAHPTNRFMGAITLKPIANNRTIDVTIERLEEDASLSLYGRNFRNSVAYSPIYFPPSYTLNKTYSVDSSVTLQSGKIHLYTTD